MDWVYAGVLTAVIFVIVVWLIVLSMPRSRATSLGLKAGKPEVK